MCASDREHQSASTLRELVVRPHHTAVTVENFEAARDFLVNVIGMRLERELDHRSEKNLGTVVGLKDPEIRWAFLEMAGYRIELFKYYRPAGARQQLRQCDIGLTHVCFQVTDADETFRRLVAAGHKMISSPLELRNGQSKPFYLIGPEGIIIEFLEIRS